MLGVTDIWTYVLGTIAIVLLPGPNSIFVLTTAARHGIRAGYRAASGVFLGDFVLMAATALGVASLLRAYPPVFLAVKYAGAAYLAFVGISMAITAIRRWRKRNGDGPVPDPDVVPVTVVPTVVPAFRRSVVISILNPKAILFYLSFFIQFLDPHYPHPVLSFALLAGIMQVCSALYLTGLIFGGTFLARQFRTRRRLASTLTAGVAAVFIGFGIKLATASLS
jgi:leucine efflux protein